MIHFPENLEKFLLAYLKKEFYRGTRREVFADRPFGEEDFRFFSKGAARLSDLFTTERGEIDAKYLNQPELRAGYLLYFLPINFGKTRFVLEKFPASFWERGNLRILDLGAGPGSASLAVAQFLREKKSNAEVEWVLVDQNERILQDARNLFAGFGERHETIRLQKSDVRRFRAQGKFDLILLSHCLNEWGPGSTAEKAEWAEDFIGRHLREDGFAAILEPALKRPTRDLMAFRDHILSSGKFTTSAPCLHDQPCPMLSATPGDWCHFYLDWEEPEFLRRLDRLIGNENRFLKVAYLILGIKPAGEITRAGDTFRVVSNRMATRGKTEVVLCGPPGRVQVTRLDKDRAPPNADLDRVRRGDLLRLPETEFMGYEVDRKWRISKKDQVKLS